MGDLIVCRTLEKDTSLALGYFPVRLEIPTLGAVLDGT